ncbi:MAG: hypothetical protein HUU35_16960 [Armatimonadetes bacterium]|nr:hypothetical protein [Armatimonadota bacterium]
MAGGRPGRLPENRGLAFNGSKIYGQGFLLTAAEAADLLHCEPAAAAVIRPYLSGDDLHGRADRLPARQVICFSDRSLEEVEARWPRCLARVRQQVLPERERLRGRNSIGNRRAAVWWQFGSPAPALYQALAGRAQVLVKVLHSHTHVFVPVPARYVFSHALAVVVDDDPALLAVLQSSLHEQWAQAHGSSLGRAPRYTLSRTLETFPLPPRTAALRRLGAELEATWRTLTTARGEGLTVLWNHLHDPAEQSDDLWTLRRLGAAVDAAVVESYGWGERLEHDFRDTSLGPRWGPAPAAAARLQARLLELNQTRLVGYQETTAGTPAAVTTARSSS